MTGKAFQADQFGIRKNLLINGDMSIAQRLGGVGTAVPAADWTYQAADRWKTLQKAGALWVLYTHALTPVGSSSRSLLFNSGGNSQKGGVIQIIENVHAVAAWGKRISLQAQLYASAEITDLRMAVLTWTGAVDAVTNPISAWNAAGTNPTLAANWAYLNTPVNLVTGTDWGLKKIENLVVPTGGVPNLAVMIWCEDETQTVSTQSWAVNDVQLEIGTKCTQFERLNIQDTLQLAQRYYEKTSGSVNNRLAAGFCLSATQAEFVLQWMVTKRVAPTVAFTAAANYYAFSPPGLIACTVIATSITPQVDRAGIITTVAGGQTAGHGALLLSVNASGFITASAEL